MVKNGAYHMRQGDIWTTSHGRKVEILRRSIKPTLVMIQGEGDPKHFYVYQPRLQIVIGDYSNTRDLFTDEFLEDLIQHGFRKIEAMPKF